MSDDKWKVFKHDTEAGRLLSRLYGTTPTCKPQIRYPKLRMKKKNEAPSIDNSDCKSIMSRKTRVSVPKFSRKQKCSDKPVDLVPRRKNFHDCQVTLEKYHDIRSKYRPPYQQPLFTETEKRNLSDVFAQKGGRALPMELTCPVVESTPCHEPMHQNEAETDDPKSQLVDHIVREIKERRHYQIAMEKLGEGAASRQVIAQEIALRLNELNRLDPQISLEEL